MFRPLLPSSDALYPGTLVQSSWITLAFDLYNFSIWSVKDQNDAHLADTAWLDQPVESVSRPEPGRKITALTHYCPLISDKVIEPTHVIRRFRADSWATSLTSSVGRARLSSFWIFGNTHFHGDFNEKCHVEPASYYFAQPTGFDEDKVVEIQDS